MGIIIGKETGKLLYMGVRNKYCSMCIHADKENKTPQEHDCYKNWDGPMVTDQGFKEAESKYGLRYTTFIGDGAKFDYWGTRMGPHRKKNQSVLTTQ